MIINNVVFFLLVTLIIFLVIFCLLVKFLYPLYKFNKKSKYAQKAYDTFYSYLTENYTEYYSLIDSMYTDIDIYESDVLFNFGNYYIQIYNSSTKSDLIIQLEAIINNSLGYGYKLTPLQLSIVSIKQHLYTLKQMSDNIRRIKLKEGL